MIKNVFRLIFYLMFCYYFLVFFIFFFYYSIECFAFFFFQAEDGIRDGTVTGVQTCALPIYQTTSLPAPVCLSKPGMLLHATPTTTASLAPPNVGNGKDGVSDAGSGVTILEDALEQGLTEMDTEPLHPGSYFRSLPAQNDGNGAELERNDAAR